MERQPLSEAIRFSGGAGREGCTAGGGKVWLCILCLLGPVFFGAASESALATPPEYLSFHRNQTASHSPAEDSLLRIWTIYVGQGDALLVQFPKRFSSSASEPIELLIDGGPSGRQLLVFLKSLVPRPDTIEHVVLTHHDGDHVSGLTALLGDDQIGVANVYHNGLVSWRLGGRGFPGEQWPATSEAVFQRVPGRGMAFVEGDGPELRETSLISNLETLTADVNDFVGEYKKFADRIVADETPSPVSRFRRTYLDDDVFAAPAPDGVRVGQVQMEPLWPLNPPRRYGDWSHTINGNSVTFRLVYDNFSMLFTGDLNEDSERELLRTFRETGRLADLHSDVLKVPHHGSRHGIREFFKQVNPVVSVASMGSRGFRADWKHPSKSVIRWLGGSHRVYHTYIHERRFSYSDLDRVRNSLIEKKHVLIETDGQWFRIVEVENPADIPDVRETTRGHGTRWISAEE